MKHAQTELDGSKLRHQRGLAGVSLMALQSLTGIPSARLSAAECGHLQLTHEEQADVADVLRMRMEERREQITAILGRPRRRA